MALEVTTPIYSGYRGSPSVKSNAKVSTNLDSIRQYQFEVHLSIPGIDNLTKEQIMVAATKVTGIGMESEAIEVHRVNDKLYYPGKAKMEPVVVTFDDQILTGVAARFWAYITKTYNPVTGTIATGLLGNNSNFKLPSMKIVQLKNDLTPYSETILYGVYPMSWKSAEFNYAQNAFHTIDVSFRYDFMSHSIIQPAPTA